MSEAALLRALADKLDQLEAVAAYPTDATDPGQLTVTWSDSADLPGYAAMSEAIATLVGQHWNALRSQVVKQRESDVQSARGALSGAPVEKHSTISANVEAALRKVAS